MIINYKLSNSLCCRKYANVMGDLIDFVIMDIPTFTKTITRPLPLHPCQSSFDESGYLHDYAQFYDFEEWGRHLWVKGLKEEYRENRPTYTITVTYKQYDGYFTEKGKQTIIDRYKQHMRLAERYATLAEELGLVD